MSSDLIEQVKTNPERFFKLTFQFDEFIATAYILAIIDGLALSNSPIEYLYDVIRRFQERFEGYMRLRVGDALKKRLAVEVPDDLIKIVAGWALSDSNPSFAEEQSSAHEILQQTNEHRDELLNRAVNSVRSSVLEDVCFILFSKQPPQLDYILTILRRLATDECDSVRVMVLEQLAYWQNNAHQDDIVIDLFRQIIENRPLMLVSSPTHRFLNWLSFISPEQATPYLDSMLNQQHEHTRYRASQFICIAGMHNTTFAPLADKLHIHNDIAIRCGAASVYAQEIGKDKTQLCISRLTKLMDDDNDQVRSKVFSCFRNLTHVHFEQIQSFIFAFIKSRALQDAADDLVDFLTNGDFVMPYEQQILFEMIEQIIEALGPKIADYAHGFYRVQRDLAIYLRKVYDQTVDNNMREKIMNLFDKLLEMRSQEAQDILRTEDSEWLPRLGT